MITTLTPPQRPTNCCTWRRDKPIVSPQRGFQLAVCSNPNGENEDSAWLCKRLEDKITGITKAAHLSGLLSLTIHWNEKGNIRKRLLVAMRLLGTHQFHRIGSRMPWAPTRDLGVPKGFRSNKIFEPWEWKIVNAPRMHYIFLLKLCVPFSYPRQPVDDNESGRSGYCKTLVEVSCVDTAEIKLLKEGNITPATCNCYDPCNEFRYRSTIHLLQYPLRSTYGDDDPTYRQQIEVYYETLKYHRFTEIPVHSTVELSSAIGT